MWYFDGYRAHGDCTAEWVGECGLVGSLRTYSKVRDFSPPRKTSICIKMEIKEFTRVDPNPRDTVTWDTTCVVDNSRYPTGLSAKYCLTWFTCILFLLLEYIYFPIYEVHTISFKTFFAWALLLIVHTWSSSPLPSNLLRLQCTCCSVPTTSGRPHGSPLVWACQWPSSQPFSSPQLSHNDSL